MKKQKPKRRSFDNNKIVTLSLEKNCKQLPLVILKEWQQQMIASGIFEESETVAVLINFVSYLTQRIDTMAYPDNPIENKLCMFKLSTWKDGSYRIKQLFHKHAWECLTVNENLITNDESDFPRDSTLSLTAYSNFSHETNVESKIQKLDDPFVKLHYLLQLTLSSNFQFCLLEKALSKNFQKHRLLLKSPFHFIEPKKYLNGQLTRISKMRLMTLDNLQEYILPLSMSNEAQENLQQQ